MRYEFKTKPWKHQKQALTRFLRQKHLALLWEPGVGKSKVIVDGVSALYKAGRIKRVLIVCPLSVVGVWEEEFEMHSPITYWITRVGPERTKLPTVGGALHVVLVNYDLMWRRAKMFVDFKPDVVVADESHKIKKPSARRSRVMRRFSSCPYRAILTGTPTPKGFIDLYGQWTFLHPGHLADTKEEFVENFCIYGGFRGFKIMGYRNADVLKAKIREDATIRRKDQTLDLPPEIVQRVPVELEETTWKMYEKMAMEFYLELKNGEIVDAKNAGVKLMKLQQITGGFVNTDQGWRQVSRAKLDNAQDQMETRLDGGYKVVVFARLLREIEALHEMGLRFGVPTYKLVGSTRPADRDLARKLFQTVDEPSVLVAQIATGGLGITLHAASESIFYSLSYSLEDWIQSRGRLHRGGQTRKVTHRVLTATGTVDIDILAALKAKMDVMAVIMGNPALVKPVSRLRRVV